MELVLFLQKCFQKEMRSFPSREKLADNFSFRHKYFLKMMS